MATNKLNSRYCDSAGKGEHYDGDGLFLLVKEDGKKYWRLATRVTGKRKLLGLGRYPEIGLADARAEVRRLREMVRQGVDPVAAKKEVQEQALKQARQVEWEAGNTFEQITRRLYDSKKGKTSEPYRDKFLRQLQIHVFPHIGHKTLKEIEGRELLELFRKVGEKENQGRKMTYMAKRLCQWTGEVYDFASVEDANFTGNPCPQIQKHLEKHETRNMTRIRFDQLPDFITALDTYNGFLITKAAIWLLLFTGQRQVSIRRATWEDFDFTNEVWNRKPEKQDKAALTLPLPKQAIKLLKEIRPFTAGRQKDLAFPSPRAGGYKMLSEAAIGAAIQRMGFQMVGHGIRGLVSTGLNELGFDSRLVEMQLGHAKGDRVEAAYNHASRLEDRRKMMSKWAKYLDNQKKLGGKK